MVSFGITREQNPGLASVATAVLPRCLKSEFEADWLCINNESLPHLLNKLLVLFLDRVDPFVGSTLSSRHAGDLVPAVVRKRDIPVRARDKHSNRCIFRHSREFRLALDRLLSSCGQLL